MEESSMDPQQHKSTGSTTSVSNFGNRQDSLLCFPPTPPDFLDTLDKEADSGALQLALHVIEIERDALTNLYAPTSSTTTALALTDALALALARRLHTSPLAVFHKHHPGGAIGAGALQTKPQLVGDIAVQVPKVPVVAPRLAHVDTTILDAILTAASSASGWVRTSSERIVAPRTIQRIGRQLDLSRPLNSLDDRTAVERGDWISIDAASSVQEARNWILQMRQSKRGKTFLKKGTILGVVDALQSVSGVIEIEEITSEEELTQ
ncbi:MAG: hypothetical protein Q9216_004841 [Gyalolechia sp. 2 TL-2023]